MSYFKGQLVRVKGSFKDVASGNLIDPSSVFVEYIDPSGQKTSLQYTINNNVIKETAGVYHVDIDCQLTGAWRYRFYSTGVGQAASEKTFRVGTEGF